MCRKFVLASALEKTDEMVSSFTIVTTTANDMLQSVGIRRMPVILSQHDELEWIKSSRHLCDVLKLLAPFPSGKMNAYPVSDMVNEKGLNGAAMLNPIGEKLLVENQSVNLNFGHWHRKEKPHTDTKWSERKID